MRSRKQQLRSLLRLLSVSTLLCVSHAFAGVDVVGPVQRLHIAGDGRLWFSMDTTDAARYCRPGWNDMTMYVPKDHPQFPYYFALLATAVSKGKRVYVANIDGFNGTAPCDITQTGYGLVLMSN